MRADDGKKAAWSTLCDSVRSSTIRDNPRVEPLLLQTEMEQLRLFGYLIKMSPGWLDQIFIRHVPLDIPGAAFCGCVLKSLG